MARPVVGVMGPGDEASAADAALAERLGSLLAREGWVVLCGGRDVGVMRAVCRGAKSVPGSLTIGVLPARGARVAPDVDVAIVTDMHDARNNVNVLSSRVVVACGAAGAGTVSEIALALKAGKTVVLLGADDLARAFFQRLGGDRVQVAATVEDAVALVRPFLFLEDQRGPA